MGTLAIMNLALMLTNCWLAFVNQQNGNFRLSWACLGVAALACLLFIFCLAHTPRPW